MSHVAESKIKITDIQALLEAVKKGCPDLELVKGTEYRTWVTDHGSLAGDYPLAPIYQLKAIGQMVKDRAVTSYAEAYAEVCTLAKAGGVTLPEKLADIENNPLTLEELKKLKQIPEFKDALDKVEKSISKDAEYVIRYKKDHPKHGKAYEVGVVPHPYKSGEYTLMTDFYQNGYGLFEAKGLGGHKQVEKDGKTIDDWGQELRQRYTVVAMRNRAQKEGKKVTKVEKLEDGSVRMEISE
tara:strand:+ start:679 stop:1398 length:720 start_codon:yes stop_codon:yes gene_type:complete